MSMLADEFGSRINLIDKPGVPQEIKDCRDLRSLIVLAKQRTSSVILNWGEDSDAWEVDIIAGGVRFSASQPMLWDALAEALMRANEA